MFLPNCSIRVACHTRPRSRINIYCLLEFVPGAGGAAHGGVLGGGRRRAGMWFCGGYSWCRH